MPLERRTQQHNVATVTSETIVEEQETHPEDRNEKENEHDESSPKS